MQAAMIEYDMSSAAIEIVGALALNDAVGGTRPSRLPLASRVQVPSIGMQMMADTTAGVRIRFASECTRIELSMTANLIEFPAAAGPLSSCVDLVIDGKLVASTPFATGRAIYDPGRDHLAVDEGDPETIVFESLSPIYKVVEIWLPHTAIVTLRSLRLDASAQPAVDERARWVHHGSSISHCLEATHPTATWPAVSAERAGLHLVDLAFAGNALLDPFVARVIRDQPASVISLKLGINLVNTDCMTRRAFTPAVHGFLDTIREDHATTPLVVVSPIYCPSAEDRPGPTAITAENPLAHSLATDPIRNDALTLRWIRAELDRIVTIRAREDPHIHYVNGLSLFDLTDAQDGLLPDGLHPDEEGYARIGHRFADVLRRIEPSLHIDAPSHEGVRQ